MVLFEVKQLIKYFGGLIVVGDVIFELNEGELVGLIGLNGVGKIIFFNFLMGVYELSEGIVILDGYFLNGKLFYKIVFLGFGRIF